MQLLAAGLVAAVAGLAVWRTGPQATLPPPPSADWHSATAGGTDGGGGGGLLASLAGLSLSYALPIVGLLNGLLTSTAETEQEMVAVERVQQYLALPQQHDTLPPLPPPPPPPPPSSGPESSPADTGPTVTRATSQQQQEQEQGRQEHMVVELRGVVVRYRPGLPAALRGVWLGVAAGRHVCVVGRTGAGKSSLVAALMRLVEVEAGAI